MKRFTRILVLLLAVALYTSLFTGCSNSKDTAKENTTAGSSSSTTTKTTTLPAAQTVPSPSDTTVSPAAETTSPVKLSYKVHSQTLKDDDGFDLVYIKITYPVIDNPNNGVGIAAINEYYKVQSDQFVTNILSEGKAGAIEEKKFSKESGYDFYPFAHDKNTDIYYNGNNLLSVLHLEYENTGGAHPYSHWASETFDVKTGKKLTLSDIFGVSTEKALEKVYEVVFAQIDKIKDTDDFFYNENYKEDVKNNYSMENFVLDHEGIIFYYEPYAIAPYAAGIPAFKLPYDKAGTLAVKIPPLKSSGLQNELYYQAGKLIDTNKEVFYDIFGLSMLQLDVPEKRPENQWIFPVKDKRFTTYSELDNYIRNTYIKSQADILMGNGRYLNKDGKLYGDMSKDGGVGYYVDWNNYHYEISDISQTSATITIYTIDDSPAGKKDITIKVKMQKENGLWLLEKMFS